MYMDSTLIVHVWSIPMRASGSVACRIRCHQSDWMLGGCARAHGVRFVSEHGCTCSGHLSDQARHVQYATEYTLRAHGPCVRMPRPTFPSRGACLACMPLSCLSHRAIDGGTRAAPLALPTDETTAHLPHSAPLKQAMYSIAKSALESYRYISALLWTASSTPQSESAQQSSNVTSTDCRQTSEIPPR